MSEKLKGLYIAIGLLFLAMGVNGATINYNALTNTLTTSGNIALGYNAVNAITVSVFNGIGYQNATFQVTSPQIAQAQTLAITRTPSGSTQVSAGALNNVSYTFTVNSIPKINRVIIGNYVNATLNLSVTQPAQQICIATLTPSWNASVSNAIIPCNVIVSQIPKLNINITGTAPFSRTWPIFGVNIIINNQTINRRTTLGYGQCQTYNSINVTTCAQKFNASNLNESSIRTYYFQNVANNCDQIVNVTAPGTNTVILSYCGQLKNGNESLADICTSSQLRSYLGITQCFFGALSATQPTLNYWHNQYYAGQNVIINKTNIITNLTTNPTSNSIPYWQGRYLDRLQAEHQTSPVYFIAEIIVAGVIIIASVVFAMHLILGKKTTDKALEKQ